MSKTLLDFVNQQAEDDGLWFIAQHASEAYLQDALRKLHALIESELSAPKPADGLPSNPVRGGEWDNPDTFLSLDLHEPTHSPTVFTAAPEPLVCKCSLADGRWADEICGPEFGGTDYDPDTCHNPLEGGTLCEHSKACHECHPSRPEGE